MGTRMSNIFRVVKVIRFLDDIFVVLVPVCYLLLWFKLNVVDLSFEIVSGCVGKFRTCQDLHAIMLIKMY